MKSALPIFTIIAVLAIPACAASKRDPHDPRIESLAVLSVDTLRKRSYGSTITIEERVNNGPHESFMTSYVSDGLRVYARVDVPAAPAPENGYPVVIFLHGWVGMDGAPSLNFYYGDDNNYAQMIDAYVDAGFVVFTPGWRGHGTVKGVPADGVEFMQAWDNGSYLSPVFYAIDVLNLLDGLSTFDGAALDLAHVNTVSHSQGGDVALIVLAVAGEGSRVRNSISASSIWSGTFPSRFTQLLTYWPMQSTPEAFMSGDDTWNATAVGANGAVNYHFVFGYPSDWIGTIDMSEWTWQKETWSIATVPEAVKFKLDQMYAAINQYVDDLDDAEYTMAIGDGQTFSIAHDSRVSAAMRVIGGFNQAQYLTEPLVLQHSDRDFYSFSAWNADLCQRINGRGGKCHDFEYPGTNHALLKSAYDWYAPADTVTGFFYAIQRDIALFSGRNPAETRFP